MIIKKIPTAVDNVVTYFLIVSFLSASALLSRLDPKSIVPVLKKKAIIKLDQQSIVETTLFCL